MSLVFHVSILQLLLVHLILVHPLLIEESKITHEVVSLIGLERNLRQMTQ